MKKTTVSALCILVLILTLASCLKDNNLQKTTAENTFSSLTTIAETIAETISETSAVTKKETTTQKQTKPETTVRTTKKAVSTTSVQVKPVILEMDYYRSLLSDKEKKLYDEWLEKITNYEEFYVDFSTAEFTYEEMHRITYAMRGDYPELRLYMGESYKYVDENDEVNYDVAINGRLYPNYTWYYKDEPFNPVYMDIILKRIDMVCDKIISRMPEGTYAEKYEYLAREIADMTVYYDDEDGMAKDWAYCYMNGPFLDGKGLCQAYAYAYQYLCKKAGLWCICTGGGCHCWNVVMLEDGSTYHVDVTWADSEYSGFDNSYFLLTQEEIELDHIHEEKEYIIANGKSLK